MALTIRKLADDLVAAARCQECDWSHEGPSALWLARVHSGTLNHETIVTRTTLKTLQILPPETMVRKSPTH